MKNEKLYSCDFGGKELQVEVGSYAAQANGAVKVTYGETVVLVTAVMSKNVREGIDFFPLSVEYEEKFYAAGRIKGSRWIKREGRPTDEAILTGRMIDRAIRPRFSKLMRNEVQIVLTVLSFDGENDPDIPAFIGASCALSLSDIPWEGPMGIVRVGQYEGNWLVNPVYSVRDKCDFEVAVANIDGGKINMLEIGANEIPAETILAAVKLGGEYNKKMIDFQKKIIAEIKSQKFLAYTVDINDEKLRETVDGFLKDKLETTLLSEDRKNLLNNLKDELAGIVAAAFPGEKKRMEAAFLLLEHEVDDFVHQLALGKGQRVDKRALNEVRDLNCEVGVLPRTHGSGFFERGLTKVLSVLTLAPPALEQYLEGMEIVGRKSFMHHYNFPGFCTGEIKPLRGPGRREIGHGSLAERAVTPVIPSREEFPYTIRIVSEVLSSNGSSSMASTCGSSLALMDAGVPIKRPVVGIAMGLMSDKEDNYKILTDIQGPEDHYGDMDCKVAASEKGITAVQMDVKVDGITLEILEETFKEAAEAHKTLLGAFKKSIEGPRPQLSPYAPIIERLQIDPSKIGEIIGPGGKIIKGIIEQSGAEIQVEDDGSIFVSADSREAINKAVTIIKGLVREIRIGEVFQGKVVKIFEFGALVEILPHQAGLVHISELAPYRVNKVEDIVSLGDIVLVKVKKIENGKIDLTIKGMSEEQKK